MSNEQHLFAGEVRYSRDMRLLRATTLGSGIGLGVGIFLLLGPVIRWAGADAPLAYLIAGILFLPVALSLAELVAASGRGDFFQLIRASGRELLSYLASWALLGGGIVLSGLLARGAAEYLSALAIDSLNLPLDPRWLAPVILLVLTINNILGTRENRLVQNAIVVAGLATLILLGAWGIGSPSTESPAKPESGFGTTGAIALLSGGLWGLLLILSASVQMHRASKDAPRALLVTLMLGSIVGALVALAAANTLSLLDSEQPFLLVDLATYLAGVNLRIWVLAIGVILLTTTLNRTLLALAHIADDMSRSGFFPRTWRKTHPQFGTPRWLLTGGGILTALVSLVGDTTLLATLGAISFLSAVALINSTTVFSSRNHLVEKRPFRLPFLPLIPGLAITICLFLLTVLPAASLVIGASWFLLGGIFYIVHARHGAADARTGVTVFREETETHAEADYRVLIPLANPNTAEALINVGAALARARGGEVLALQVIAVPDQTSLLAGRRAARRQWSLLERAVSRAEEAGVPVHPIVRIAHNPAQGILDTAHEEGCDLILMGWRGEPTEQTFELGSVIDPVVIQAPCDVAILKGELPDQLKRVLIPTAGGPHAPAALQIGLDLTKDTQAEVIALNLIRGPLTPQAREGSQRIIDQTLANTEDADRVSRRIAHTDSIQSGILEVVARCDLLLIGASDEGLLDQTKFGGLPEDVARACSKPVILVKHYRGLSQFWLQRLWMGLSAAFPQLDKSEQIEVYRSVRRGARPDVDFFVLIVLSAIIATLGLLQNSAAVIIGAMLVAPLMTPILAISLGIVRGDVRLLRLSVESALKGITLAIVVAVGMALLTPRAELTAEITARTHPTLLDLIVALASGAAGAYAIGRKEVAAALPGVAIAAALVPPLCVVGTGIALSQPSIAGGAFLLFTTNLIAISLAGAIVFLLLGFRPAPDERERQRRFWQGLALSLALLLAISVPLGFFLVQTVQEGQRQQIISEILTRETQAANTTLLDFETQHQARSFYVMARVYASQPPSRETVKHIQNELSRGIRSPVRLEVVVIPVTYIPAE